MLDLEFVSFHPANGDNLAEFRYKFTILDKSVTRECGVRPLGTLSWAEIAVAASVGS